MQTTKKLLYGVICGASLIACQVVNAISFTFNDAYYVGKIVNGIPPSEDNEFNWVNQLITLAPGTSALSTNPAGETLTRSANTLDYPSMPLATNVDKDDTGPFLSFVVKPGSLYVLGKYGNSENGPEGIKLQASYVWYLGDLVGQTVSLPQNALSHQTVMSVPDGGLTVMMLGAALTGLGVMRRKLA